MTDNGSENRQQDPKNTDRWADCVYLTTAAGTISAGYLETRSAVMGMATALVAVALVWRGQGRG